MSNTTCSVPICNRPEQNVGLCNPHYLRQYRHGDLDPDRPIGGWTSCTVQDCSAAHSAKGYCRTHYNLTYNKSNPRDTEKSREHARRFRATHPDRAANYQRVRRARKQGADSEYVDALVVLELHDGVCGICGDDVDPFDYEVDHIVPLILGGSHNYSNTQPAHAFCNRSKGGRLKEADNER